MWKISKSLTAARPADAAYRIAGAVAFACLLGAGTASAQSYQFAFQVGSTGQFQYPNGVAIDRARHHVLVSDGMLNNVQIFTSSNQFIGAFGGPGTAAGLFDYPAGLHADPSTGNIVVADYANRRLQVFSPAGAYLSQFSGGQLATPCDVAFDPVAHHMFVPDGYDARVLIYDASGAYLSSFGSVGTGPGQFTYACGITLDTVTSHVLVDDEINNNVQVFTTTGAYLGQFGGPGQANGQLSSPGGMAIDPVTRHIFVSDYGNNRVQIFTSDGAYVDQFGADADGGLDGPDGIDIDPATFSVFVADRGHARVLAFTPTASSCGPTAVDLSVDPPVALLSQSLLFSAQADIESPFAGTVSFIVDGGGTACVANMHDVDATCLHPLQLGTHTVVAQYSGDGLNPPGCSAPQTVTIESDTTGASTDLACSSIPNPAIQGQPAQVLCQVSPGQLRDPVRPDGTSSITGYVTYAQGDTVLANVPLAFGTATYTNILGGGSYPITATYSGDAADASSVTDITVVVQAPADDVFYSGFEVGEQ